MNLNRIIIPFLLLPLCISFEIAAQNSRDLKATALEYLRANPAQFELTQEDVADLRIVREYQSRHNGLTHIWVQQQRAGIPVEGGLFGLHIQNNTGQIYHLGHDFVRELNKRTNTTLPALGATRALELVMNHLGFNGFKTPLLKEKINGHNFRFEAGSISRSDIPIHICYFPVEDGSVRLAWNVLIDQINTADHWTLYVDALTGKILHQRNHTQYCKAGHPVRTGTDHAECMPLQQVENHKPESLNAVESYRVFALPTESPAHGSRSLLVNPADPQASPFGWLDVNGVQGNEYNYTRGNNVWAFDDSANDDIPLESESAYAGPGLNFDFPFNPDAEPEANRDAAITNLFYMNNMMHDIAFKFGFDEEAGNFQQKNYTGAPGDSDAVLANALDGGGENNANFNTPQDGYPGRMQMFKWTRVGGRHVTVNTPQALQGQYFGGIGNWGKPITTIPVTGDVVLIDDGTGTPTLGCDVPINDVSGKIVLTDRGDCTFGEKALYAQQAGAIGCIVCDHEDPPIGIFGPGTFGSMVTIPVVYIKKADCEIFKQYAGNGLNISLVTPPVESGPDRLDGDFDNGIIAHEYGHGISNRLTGDGFGCLGNKEQMGEGWSDFFTLAFTVNPGDIGANKQGIGTYVFRQGNDGTGIRRFPYSTDMSINPVTYAMLPENPNVHPLGEVWAATLWDLYWAMVEKYGYDANLENHNSGNFRAIQLVFDGLKLQPCAPGFVSGRDAIMLADKLNYQGADTCLISSVFARRGIGYLASEGNTNNAIDGIENFDPIPTCVKELKITKTTTTPTLNPGEVAEFQISITNHKDETLTNVVVTDPLPAGLTLVEASNGGVLTGGEVRFNLGAMASGQTINLNYKAKTDENLGSLRIFQDNMEDTQDQDWYSVNYSTQSQNQVVFQLQSDNVKVGAQAWFAESPEEERSILLANFTPFPVSGNRPTLRFWHQHETEKGADAGFFELRDTAQTAWERLSKDKGLRNTYTGRVQYRTFAIPGLLGFSGPSNGWRQSYFDLSHLKDKMALIRFRFGSNELLTVVNAGWWVDQMEIIDLVNYDTEACVTADGGNQACSRVPEAGIIMNPATVNTEDLLSDIGIAMFIQPNPASDLLHIGLDAAMKGPVRLSLIGVDGRVVLEDIRTNGLARGSAFALRIGNLTPGIYAVRMETEQGVVVGKMVKE